MQADRYYYVVTDRATGETVARGQDTIPSLHALATRLARTGDRRLWVATDGEYDEYLFIDLN